MFSDRPSPNAHRRMLQFQRFASAVRYAGFEPVLVRAQLWQIQTSCGTINVTPGKFNSTKHAIRCAKEHVNKCIPKKRNRGLGKRIRKRLTDQGQTHCAYCGVDLSTTKSTIDHIVPLSRGGTNSIKNLVLACFRCNHRKGDQTPEQWERTRKQQAINRNHKSSRPTTAAAGVGETSSTPMHPLSTRG